VREYGIAIDEAAVEHMRRNAWVPPAVDDSLLPELEQAIIDFI
jgi:hypothetical protein